MDASLPPVEIARPLLHELYAHALESYPEECCGLLTGDTRIRFRSVHRCRNEMTRLHRHDRVNYPRDGSQAFHMNESDYLDVVRKAEARSEEVTGVYHSHVDADAYFSELDQDFASQPLFPFPEAHHVVVSVLDRKVRGAGAFRYLPDAQRFEGRGILAVTP